MNQQYLMNISKYPHPWRTENNAYIILLERQKLANKTVNINKQVGGASFIKIFPMAVLSNHDIRENDNYFLCGGWGAGGGGVCSSLFPFVHSLNWLEVQIASQIWKMVNKFWKSKEITQDKII